MYKFFVDGYQVNNEKVEINGDDRNHIVKVLRMREGEDILVTDKDSFKTYSCTIEKIDKDKVTCNIIKKLENTTELKIKIDLYQGLPKADKMEYIIQKAVELGVNKVVPVNMKYCIAKLKDEEKKNIRWVKIAEAAAKQSKRNIIPKVENSVSVDSLCERIKDYDLAIVAYENEENVTIKDVLKENKNISSIAVIIGPEGGMSITEVNKLKERGAKVVSLGKRILRTETAPVTVLSIISYEYDM